MPLVPLPCQVAACLLLFLEEDDAFWMMCAIIEDLLPASYFSTTLLGVQTDQRVLRHLIVQYLPRLDRLLQEHDIGEGPTRLCSGSWGPSLGLGAAGLRPQDVAKDGTWQLGREKGACPPAQLSCSLPPRLLHSSRAWGTPVLAAPCPPPLPRRVSTELSLITLHWFLTAFASVVHIRLLLRLWDLFFYEGSLVLFQATLGMLRLKVTAQPRRQRWLLGSPAGPALRLPGPGRSLLRPEHRPIQGAGVSLRGRASLCSA